MSMPQKPKIDRSATLLKGVILPAISHRASTNSNNTTFDLINKLIRSIFDGGPDTDPQSSTTQNIDKIISPLEDEIETCNSDEIDLEALSAALQKRAEAQLTRFSLQRDIINLNRLIYLYEVMTQFLDPSVPNDIHDLRLVLISLLSIRYFLFKESGHLDSLIGSLEEFLSGTQGSQDYGLYRPLLSQALVLSSWDHLDIEPNTKDCDRILQLCDDIPTSTFQAEHSSWRFIKSDAIERLSMLGRKCHNLTDALECLQAGQDIDPELGFPYSVFQVLVSQLKIAVIAGDWQLLLEVEKEIQTRPTEEWLHAGASIFRPDSDADLDKTVEVLRQRYRSCPSGDLCAHLCSIVLAWALLDRFRRLRKFSDIQEAVAFREVFEPDKIFKVDFLLFLQTMEYNSLSENRWRRQEATKGRACDNIPDGINPGPSNSSRFSDAQAPNVVAIQKLAALYGSDSPIGKHMSLRNAILQHADKDEVFQTTRDELLSLCEQSNNPSLYLTDLCMLYQSRYNITNRIEDLETAVKYYLQSLKDPEPASTRGTSFAHILLLLESLKPGSVTPSQFLEMHDFLRGAANDATVVYNDRLDHINWWFRILFARRAVKEERKGHALGMANLTLSLLEQQSWESPTSRAFLDARYDTEGLLTTAAFSIIHSDPTNMPRAIEILERGRSLLWSQLDSLRTPPSALASVPPQLATRFLETSRALQRRMGLSHEIGNDPPGTYHQQIVDDRNQVIEEIRVLTGFEHFLKPKSFSELHTTAAAEGPIVILMPSYSQCLAVVFVRSESVVFPLPISVSRLSDLHGCIQPHQSPRSAGSEVADSLGTSTSSSGDNRAGVRTSKRKLHMDDVLKILWLEVAKPVIDVIMETTGKLKEKNNTPNRERRGRLWWCCLGEFSFMPIHAAGIYRGSPQVSVSDYFLSSYTPSLGALIKSRERPHPTDLKVFAAIQPNPGTRRWLSLRYAKEELKEITSKVPHENLIFPSDSGQPDFEGTYTSVKNVIDKLPEATVLHLACHGEQNLKDPLKSGFILANAEVLTIEEMMKHRLPNAHTAILSACYTNSNDAKQPDESINLAFALMHLGFSSILATKWPMVDSHGPIIARAVYDAMFGNPEESEDLSQNGHEVHSEHKCGAPQPDTTTEVGNHIDEAEPKLAAVQIFSGSRLAEVVDTVARKLRESGVSSSHWATFVHVGV